MVLQLEGSRFIQLRRAAFLKGVGGSPRVNGKDIPNPTPRAGDGERMGAHRRHELAATSILCTQAAECSHALARHGGDLCGDAIKRQGSRAGFLPDCECAVRSQTRGGSSAAVATLPFEALPGLLTLNA